MRAQQTANAAIADRQARSPLPAFDRPTEFPDRPVTEGLSTGPGAGPEILRLAAEPAPGDGARDELASASRYLPVLEQLASMPGASVSTRNLIRRIRGGAQLLDGGF